MPDNYFGIMEQQRSEANIATQRYWKEQERKKREERKKENPDERI